MKPDKKLAVPAIGSDLWAILDNYTIMNQSSPIAGEDYTDNYYLTEASYNAIANVDRRNNYIWSDRGERIGDWSTPYRAIFYANVVLDELENMDVLSDRDEIEGSALFFRAFLFYELAQVFAPQYSSETLMAASIPLRLTADLNVPSSRSTVEETYNKITDDLKYAAAKLPTVSSPKNRPSKAAAYGMLARVYLNMGDYLQAGYYADSCLAIYNELIDFSKLSITASAPIARFNEEVIFASRSYTESTLLFTSRCRVDTVLYDLYEANDLRKLIYFRPNADGSYTVKASYDGSYAGAFFNGIATDEQYLILSECQARLGHLEDAMNTLSVLMRNRKLHDVNGAFGEPTAEQALDIILGERRKELFMRGTRWSDIRRLNLEDRYRVTLERKIGDKRFVLPPNDSRYVTPIPNIVKNASDL